MLRVVGTCLFSFRRWRIAICRFADGTIPIYNGRRDSRIRGFVCQEMLQRTKWTKRDAVQTAPKYSAVFNLSKLFQIHAKLSSNALFVFCAWQKICKMQNWHSRLIYSLIVASVTRTLSALALLRCSYTAFIPYPYTALLAFPLRKQSETTRPIYRWDITIFVSARHPAGATATLNKLQLGGLMSLEQAH